jgi:hypothetical protein
MGETAHFALTADGEKVVSGARWDLAFSGRGVGFIVVVSTCTCVIQKEALGRKSRTIRKSDPVAAEE